MTLVKKNKILAIALMGYMILGLFQWDMMIEALGVTKYYLLEMLQILPAVFVLTALIQTWVPTSTIIKYFGNGSGLKGYVISFLIGSLSAGPIYAAFPICKTLLKKGASIKNIVIILSAWAVIKVPMLINEVKFMGYQYMLIRWILTLMAVLIMANLIEKLIDPSFMVQEESLRINHERCIMCRACIKKFPDAFEEKNSLICIKDDTKMLEEHFSICPVGAIEP